MSNVFPKPWHDMNHKILIGSLGILIMAYYNPYEPGWNNLQQKSEVLVPEWMFWSLFSWESKVPPLSELWKPIGFP